MKTVRAYLRKSLCSCGYSVLKDEIPLGRIYETLENNTRDDAVLFCGGCGTSQQVKTVAVRDGDGDFRQLPVAIFGESVDAPDVGVPRLPVESCIRRSYAHDEVICLRERMPDVQQVRMHLCGDCPCTDAEECASEAWTYLLAVASEAE